MIAFSGPQTFDLRSIKKACIHIARSDGLRLIPFYTCNMFYRDTLEKNASNPYATKPSPTCSGLVRIQVGLPRG